MVMNTVSKPEKAKGDPWGQTSPGAAIAYLHLGMWAEGCQVF